MEKEIIILNKPVKILFTKTECGIEVLITGGDFAHIGAISIVDPKGEICTKTFEGHKDNFISEEWAEKLYEKFQVPWSCQLEFTMTTLIPTDRKDNF